MSETRRKLQREQNAQTHHSTTYCYGKSRTKYSLSRKKTPCPSLPISAENMICCYGSSGNIKPKCHSLSLASSQCIHYTKCCYRRPKQRIWRRNANTHIHTNSTLRAYINQPRKLQRSESQGEIYIDAHK